MPADLEASLDNRLVSQTETYLDTVSSCVNLVPQLLEDYSRGDEYRETADAIGSLEGDCDEQQRQLSSLLSNATVEDIGLRNTRIHLNTQQVFELYKRLDEVANTAERIAEELVTIAPPRIEPVFQRLREMAQCATTAISALDDAVTTFTRLLCSYDQSDTITDEIRTVRRAEATCDSLRNELIESVFADDSVAQPLVYREFALLLDRLVDTMEDVADQVVLISSNESWITTEPVHEP